MTDRTAGIEQPNGIPAVEGGTTLAFRYVLGERIAVGDTAEIYKAREHQGSVEVVVKLVRPAVAGQNGGTFALRLAEQAESLRSVVHPGIVRLIADGWDEPLGARFIVLEHLAGETLETLLAKKHRLAMPPALTLADALCEVTSFLHEHGLLQLDLYPASVVLTEANAPFPLKLADAGRFRAGEAPLVPTRPNGSAGYLAPERLRGEPCDARADVHAIGAVLYRMLGGHAPFRGSTADEVLESRKKGVAPLFAAGVSPADEADRAVRRCLADDPEKRFATIAELRTTLADLRAKLPGAVRRG
jgi:serine/threonine protein kinase